MVLLAALLVSVISAAEVNGEIVRGLPCVKRLNQLYCDNGGGYNYPMSAIETYIDDNKNLMRRMYGTLVKEEMPPPQNPQTPASTTFVRSVRNFGGSRFRRSTEEGKKILL